MKHATHRTPRISPTAARRALGALALALAAASCGEPEPTSGELLDAIDRARTSYVSEDRSEFLGAMELRLDRLRQVRQLVDSESSTSGEVEELAAACAELLLQLGTEDDVEWKRLREELVAEADRYEDSVRELVREAGY